MSLINDMLRDLEARRASEQRLPAGLLQGMGTGQVRTARRTLLVALITLSAVLAVVVIWLVWQRYGTPAPSSTPALAQAPAPAVVTAPAARTAPAASSPAAPVVADVVPATAPVIAPPPPPVAAAVLPAPVTAPVAPMPAPRAVAPTDTAEPAVVEKTVRAPSPQQQAEIEYQRGVAALRGGDHKAAESAFRGALRHDAGHLLARETLAAMLLGAGRLIEADEVLEQGRRFFARNPTLALLLARLRVEQGQTGAAVTILEQSLHAAVARPDYLAFLAALYQRELRYDESVESYGRALAIQPQQSSWWVGMGISLENAGRRDDAVKAYEQAAEGSLPPQLQDHVRSRLQALK
ncbi:MAG: tetratricopeptide repeat protein [Pseudomonadota bacterium]